MFDIQEEIDKHNSEYREIMQLMIEHSQKLEFFTSGLYISIMKQQQELIVLLLKLRDESITEISIDTTESFLSDIICSSTALHKMAYALL